MIPLVLCMGSETRKGTRKERKWQGENRAQKVPYQENVSHSIDCGS